MTRIISLETDQNNSEYDGFEGWNELEEDENENEFEEDGSERQDQLKRKADPFEFLGNATFKQEELSHEVIETDMCEYMRINSKKILNWMRFLAKSLSCRSKFAILEERTSMSGEDLIQETFDRVFKTFHDNEKRLPICQACSHQCDEFKLRLKKKNTEKFANSKNRCRPYMYYDYSESYFHNYIVRSLAQNIDSKLKRLTKNGEYVTVRMGDRVGSNEDSCELEALLADVLNGESPVSKELIERLMSKKLVFTNKLLPFALLPDVYDVPDEYVEVANKNYNEYVEQEKAARRKMRRAYGMEISEDLQPTPKTININVGKPIVDLENELRKRFELIQAFWEKDEFWRNHVQALAEEQDLVKIGFFDKKKLQNLYEVNLDYILPDEDIRRYLYERGDSISEIQRAEEEAKLDMIEDLPYIEDWLMDSEENFLAHYRYLLHYDHEEDLKMEYDPKNTEIQIVDANHVTIPLPLCTYAEVSVQDFIGMYLDLKEGEEFFKWVTSKTDYQHSYREFWVDFENRRYNIVESSEFNLHQKKRRAIYNLERIIRRMRGKSLDEKLLEPQETFLQESKLSLFPPLFAKKVISELGLYVKKMELDSCIKHTTMELRVPRKYRLSKEEREERARAKVKEILMYKNSLENTYDTESTMSSKNLKLMNLKPQELFSSILETIPKQEIRYVKERVKVLCTSQSDSQKSLMSV